LSNEAKACVELDHKNVVLREQIVQLEDKVKVLQVAMGGAPAGAAAGTTQAAQPARPQKARPAPAPVPDEPLPWTWIAAAGAAVLVAGAALAYRTMRKANKTKEARGFIASVKDRLKAASSRGAEPKEPTLES